MPEQNSNNTAALELSRRKLLAAAATAGGLAMTAAMPARAALTKADFDNLAPYGNGTLPGGVRARHVPNALKRRAGLWCSCFTVFPTLPTAGAR